MIPEERIKMLQFQATHYGLTESVAARLKKEGVKLETQAGLMVAITVRELQDLLSHYPLENKSES